MGYIITGLFLFIVTLFINQRKKWLIFFISAGLWIISLCLVSRINQNYDFTFNKINSLSENSIKVLNKLKHKNIVVNLYIRKYGPKWRTADDLIKLFKLNFNNIEFNFINPETADKEYGVIEFICDSNRVEQLSIDEDVFTESIYYVATDKKIKVDVKKVTQGKPYKFRRKHKIFYLLWTLMIILGIFLIRKIFLTGGETK